MLRVSLTEAYDSQLKEKDGDLIVLRREMLEAVTKFSEEKQHWEQVFLQKGQQNLFSQSAPPLSLSDIAGGRYDMSG